MYIGEFFKTGKGYVLYFGDTPDNKPLMVNLVVAKPFERDSCLCVGRHSIKNKKKPEVVNLRMSGMPFIGKREYSDCVGHVTSEEAAPAIRLMTYGKYKTELNRLLQQKQKLYNRLGELKNKRAAVNLNNGNCKELDREVDEICKKLGFEVGNPERRERFRIAPTEGKVKFVSGGGVSPK